MNINLPKISQSTLKLALSGSASTYALLGGLLLLLGVLHVLHSIPFLSETLEILGLYYSYKNRSTLFAKASKVFAPVAVAAKSAIVPENDTDV